MFNKKSVFAVFLMSAGVSVMAFAPSHAAGPSSNPVGTFVLTVSSAGAPTFKELLTLHPGGTISETNTTLHPNSANPFFNFNGSDGHGTWERGPAKTVVFKFVKIVFDGSTNEHVGYLVVDATARIDGNSFTNLVSDVNILLGPDLFNPVGLIPLGPTDAVGTRITLD